MSTSQMKGSSLNKEAQNSKGSGEGSIFRSILALFTGPECRKIVPMLIMVFLICFNYSILRNLKDALTVTAKGSSAGVIPFVKVYAMLPMAIFMTIVFNKLSERFSQDKVIYYMISGFLAFFAIFAFVLFPNRELLHPHAFADQAELILPKFFQPFISMIRNWSYTAFYVMSELWSSMILSVIFYGFVNEVVKVSSARVYYSAITIFANLSTILAGTVGSYFSQDIFFSFIPFGEDSWEQGFLILISLVLIGGLATIYTFRWLNKNVLNSPSYTDLHHTFKKREKKKKLSIKESIRHLFQNRYMLWISILVVGYNLVINLIEIVWKDQLRELYPNGKEFGNILFQVTTWVGILSFITAIFMNYIMKICGWVGSALICPLVMLVTSILYFGVNLLGSVESNLLIFGASPLALAVFIGAVQNCISKAAKYTVFDATKEMTLIPLDHEVKLRGKAAIDGVGSRFGKSGGSLIHQGLFSIFHSTSASLPVVADVVMITISGWLYAVKALGKLFNDLITQKGETIDVEPIQEVVTTEKEAITA